RPVAVAVSDHHPYFARGYFRFVQCGTDGSRKTVPVCSQFDNSFGLGHTTPTQQLAQHTGPASRRVGRSFEHDRSGSFPKHRSGPGPIERTQRIRREESKIAVMEYSFRLDRSIVADSYGPVRLA